MSKYLDRGRYASIKAKKSQKESKEEGSYGKKAKVESVEVVPWIPVLLTVAALVVLSRSGMGRSVKVGQYFTLGELTHTNTGLPNYPSGYQVENLTHLVKTVLDPLREDVGPLIISSGYRSNAVNTAVGGSISSQHLKGEAVDIVPTASSIAEVVDALHGLPVDQVITYSDSNHIHISATSGTNRHQFLYHNSGGYEEWIA